MFPGLALPLRRNAAFFGPKGARLLLLLLALALAGMPARPASAGVEEVDSFVRGIGEAAVDLLRPGGVDAAARRETVAALLRERFDLDGIAQLALGRFWRTASAAQRHEFQHLFAGFMTNLYANSLDRDPDAPPLVSRFAVDKVRAAGAAPGGPPEYVALSHFERLAGPPFRIEWRVRAAGEGYRVADVSVEGISMVVLFRQMLTNAVHDAGGDVEGLLAQLRAMTDAGDTGQ
jgi:phospholipid transport system substrate-binding protein